MSSAFTKVAAVAAASALVFSGAQVAQAQDTASLSTGSLKAYGQEPDSGSLLQPVDATGNGSIDTANTIGEPTSGSISGILTQVEGSFNFSRPAAGTGSVDTTNSSVGEPTTGSLAGIWGPISQALGMNEGITSIPGSSAEGTGSISGVLPLLLVGGSIAAGIAAAPMIQNLLPKPVVPQVPNQPTTPNGRG